MEVKDFMNTLDTVAGMKEEKSFLKTLATNKFLIGSVAVAGGTMLIKAIRNVGGIQGILASLLPTSIFNVGIGGIPLGGVAFKMLSLGGVGVFLTEGVKLAFLIKGCKSKAELSEILFKECVGFIILVMALVLLGSFGVSMLNNINDFSLPSSTF